MQHREEGSDLEIDLDALVDVLETAPVTLGVLYGSVARGDETASSDVDVAVRFDDSLSSRERTTARLELVSRLSAALGTDEVDVVPVSGMTADLLDDVCRDGILLVGSDDEARDLASAGSDERERTDPVSRLDELIADLDGVV